jgi:hypothetical protein
LKHFGHIEVHIPIYNLLENSSCKTKYTWLTA